MNRFKNIYDCDDEVSCLKLFSQFDNMPGSVTFADMSKFDRPLVYANAAFYELTGYSAEEVLGINCRFLGGKDTDKTTLEKISTSLIERNSIEVELINYRKNGTPFWNLLRLHPIKTRNPNLDYYMALQLDVSSVLGKHAQVVTPSDLHNERLLTIGAMSAGIAHEINNPIFGVIMNIDYVRDNVQDPNLIEALDQSLAELKRVGNIVKNLLGFSRKKEMYKNQKVQLHELILETISLAKTQVRKKWIDIVLELPDTLPLVFANEDSIKQILLNLIINAIHALTDGEIKNPLIRIAVDVCDAEHILQLYVIDNGKGIASELQEKIFLPFFTTKEEGAGTGLGLSLAASMAQEFGGSLTLDTAYSAGAKFILKMPIFTEFSEQNKEIDPTCLASIKSLLDEHLEEVISLYLNDLTIAIDEIDELRLVKDWISLDKRIHRLKASSLSTCSNGVAQQCVLYQNELKDLNNVNEHSVSVINTKLQQSAVYTIKFFTSYLNNQ
jgi:PAS domain S-box-containing protein